MCTKRSLQIKAEAEQEGERQKNNLWWGLLNESVIPTVLTHDIRKTQTRTTVGGQKQLQTKWQNKQTRMFFPYS